MYAYIETSSPRIPGDTARLVSPWMRGPQCMTFFYHMYGSTMGCIVIYIRSQSANLLKPLWLRSEDVGDHWIQGQISINETTSYQVSCKKFAYSISKRVLWPYSHPPLPHQKKKQQQQPRQQRKDLSC